MESELIVKKLAPYFKDLFKKSQRIHIPSIPRAGEAAMLWALFKSSKATIAWIAEGQNSLEIMHRNMLTLSPGTDNNLLYYPAREMISHQKAAEEPDISGNRLEVLLKISHATYTEHKQITHHHIITTCIQALMQKVIGPKEMRSHTITLTVQKDMELDEVIDLLEKAGYRFNPEVQDKCTASLKGGLLDLWPPTETWPFRVEFAGSTVESIRSFDPVNQRSRGKIETLIIPPANDWSLPMRGNNSLLSHMPNDTIFVWSDAGNIREHAKIYEETAIESHAKDTIISFDAIEASVMDIKDVRQIMVGLDTDESETTAYTGLPDFSPVGITYRFRQDIFQPDLMEESRRKLLSDLSDKAEHGYTIIIYLDTPGSLEHHRKLIEKNRFSMITTETGVLTEGFISDALKLVLVSESDLYGTHKTHSRRYDPSSIRTGPERMAGMRVSELTDIEPGDLVVHTDHGIGKYRGLNEIRVNGELQEVLTIEYADKAKLHVPVSQAHLLSRYVGISRRNVKLHTLGGKGWSREKASAEHSIADLAASLLETQAQRSLLEGHAFPNDTPWQYEFEASFPYVETQDQQKVISDVKQDMQSRRPMDRLVCGDAGYGKTEVAMRAAFKAVMDARQVAVLVPTTVLAQQHFQTFTERMAPYPIRVEMLSRFCAHNKHVQIVKAIAEGKVDIVIGTHSLLQPDITFKNLGLVIVDEEQRFGVAHKEKFKQMRRLVDILTLTATPIPRTLYMSMTGARDMSLLQTPPRERMAIETILAKNTDEVVREAILREINRDGQVFYLHNRVMTIEHVRQRLEQIVPEARIAVAHGQMASRELASVMQAFVEGEINILLCTTIIESGMDIPRANTILIDRADRFGMADLYQLRGRVGRSSHKAYAYLLIPSHGYIDFDARKRIGAVKKYSGLSAGFNIALRDLEIRGAGNLLGAEQSGHITAIGFGLYCQLLRRSVAQLKKEPVPPVIDVDLRLDFIRLTSDSTVTDNSAVIPYEYIEDEKLRIGVYRRIAETCTINEITGLREEFTDRFGAIPPPLNRLLKMAAIRIICAKHQIKSAETREDKLMMMRNNDYLMINHHFPRLTGATPDTKLDEIINIMNSLC
ncbi:MAG: transcription-repair coupling factor [Kiritimatiellae bacterium]|nr:transcription-repair coupling factor [Kiritimatiellia bacterium]MDD5521446.1 transcription-repair coupling factor [Kiritimatiellia bacterium]